MEVGVKSSGIKPFIVLVIVGVVTLTVAVLLAVVFTVIVVRNEPEITTQESAIHTTVLTTTESETTEVVVTTGRYCPNTTKSVNITNLYNLAKILSSSTSAEFLNYKHDLTSSWIIFMFLLNDS